MKGSFGTSFKKIYNVFLFLQFSIQKIFFSLGEIFLYFFFSPYSHYPLYIKENENIKLQFEINNNRIIKFCTNNSSTGLQQKIFFMKNFINYAAWITSNFIFLKFHAALFVSYKYGSSINFFFSKRKCCLRSKNKVNFWGTSKYQRFIEDIWKTRVCLHFPIVIYILNLTKIIT